MLTVSQAMLVVFVVVFSMLGFWLLHLVREMRTSYKNMEAGLESLAADMKLIAASKRMSVYLAIERKGGLPISPEQFEANKPILEGKVLAEFEEQIQRGRVNEDAGAASWSIISRSGLKEFMKAVTPLDNALSRLLSNKDLDGARKLLLDAVAAL